jgi:hypothetical protein
MESSGRTQLGMGKDFIAFRDLNGPGLPEWPAYSSQDGFQLMHLSGRSIQAAADQLHDRYEFLDAQTAKATRKARGGSALKRKYLTRNAPGQGQLLDGLRAPCGAEANQPATLLHGTGVGSRIRALFRPE